MKILCGVQGTGNGHIARARLMAHAFSLRGDVKVDYLFSGRPPEKYFDMQPFGDYQTREGLSFVTKDGALNKADTLREAKFSTLIHDIRHLNIKQYDLVINDFEPISAWAAKLNKVPCLSISHQAAFAYPVPTEGLGVVNRLITKYFAPAHYSLGVHWFHYGYPIIPPFVLDDVCATSNDNYVLVYLPFENKSQISDCLTTLSDVNFYCYHPDIDHTFVERNITWFPLSKLNFHNALLKCKGVIANGGFELATECLSLGKKLLMKPLTGQYEQFSNALTLQELELCEAMYQLNADDIEEWLSTQQAPQVTFPTNLNTLIDWIIKRQWHDTREICEQLWSEVLFPQHVKAKLGLINH